MIEELGGVLNPILSRDMMMYQVGPCCMWISVSGCCTMQIRASMLGPTECSYASDKESVMLFVRMRL